MIREATVGDLEWVNANNEGWEVHEFCNSHAGKEFALDDAWGVFVACTGNGERVGWTYVVEFDDHITLELLYVSDQHRRRGVARALVDDLFARYRGKILLGTWDRDLFDVWLRLGFVYEAGEHDRPGSYSGPMTRPALEA